jgi:hypothetical protein
MNGLAAASCNEWRDQDCVLPRNFRQKVFAMFHRDNLDSQSRQTKAKASFHGVSISGFQFVSRGRLTYDAQRKCIEACNFTLSQL